MEERPFLDELLPEFDVESSHAVKVEASIETTYDAARYVDLSRSWTIRALFRLRGLPVSALSIDGLQHLHFKSLIDERPDRLVLGLVGQFWTPSGHLLDFDPAQFRQLHPPGFAKATWSFDIEALSPDACRLSTVTRVHCIDSTARQSFLRYWRFVGPFSGLIRRRMLHLLKASAEKGPT